MKRSFKEKITDWRWWVTVLFGIPLAVGITLTALLTSVAYIATFLIEICVLAQYILLHGLIAWRNYNIGWPAPKFNYHWLTTMNSYRR